MTLRNRPSFNFYHEHRNNGRENMNSIADLVLNHEEVVGEDEGMIGLMLTQGLD